MTIRSHPFDDDKLREECGVFGVWGADSAAALVALGLFACCAELVEDFAQTWSALYLRETTIAGAGLAGLQCARRLAGAGVDIHVLEADDHVGGRVSTDVVDGHLCDRGFQVLNPSYPLDQHEGVRWDNCFPSYVAAKDAVVVRPAPDDPDAIAWHTRVAVVPPGKIAPVPLGPAWMAPLLTGVEPDEGDPSEGVPPSPTIRTISVRLDFVPADRARQHRQRQHIGHACGHRHDLHGTLHVHQHRPDHPAAAQLLQQLGGA